MADPIIERGVKLLDVMEFSELELPEVIDRLDAVTSNAHGQRQILEEAERRGVIDRDGRRVDVGGRDGTRLQEHVVRRDVAADCRRCGQGIENGYFLQTEETEFGPFGSTCIEYVTGASV